MKENRLSESMDKYRERKNKTTFTCTTMQTFLTIMVKVMKTVKHVFTMDRPS